MFSVEGSSIQQHTCCCTTSAAIIAFCSALVARSTRAISSAEGTDMTKPFGLRFQLPLLFAANLINVN